MSNAHILAHTGERLRFSSGSMSTFLWRCCCGDGFVSETVHVVRSRLVTSLDGELSSGGTESRNVNRLLLPKIQSVVNIPGNLDFLVVYYMLFDHGHCRNYTLHVQ